MDNSMRLRTFAAKHDFFEYCRLMAPDFYKMEREYQIVLADDLQDFLESDDDVLVLNLPPRFGKSRTASLFSSWVLGNYPQSQIMTASYNEDLSTMFSTSVRNIIQQPKEDDRQIVYSDVFDTKVADGQAQKSKWTVEGGYNSYRATSPGGSSTGYGASLMIIDDLIKGSREAFDMPLLEQQWNWFVDTMLSRLEDGAKLIIIMTRWSTKDVAGRGLVKFKEAGYNVKHINMKAMNDNGEMLCDDILSRKSFEIKKKLQSPEIFNANYQQEPIDKNGGMYKKFLTYPTGVLPEFYKVWNYTDTADTGKDYHTSIVFGETSNHQAYILDVIHTQEDMSVTEKLEANQLIKFEVNTARIERNNGGVGFERNVKRLTQGSRVTYDGFHQSANKESRIYSNSSWIEDNVFYPEDWGVRWPSYYSAMHSYMAGAKNEHDDAPDATTGIAETINKNQNRMEPIDLASVGF